MSRQVAAMKCYCKGIKQGWNSFHPQQFELENPRQAFKLKSCACLQQTSLKHKAGLHTVDESERSLKNMTCLPSSPSSEETHGRRRERLIYSRDKQITGPFCFRPLRSKQTKSYVTERRPCEFRGRLITIEYVWFPVVQTLIAEASRQRGDTLKAVSKVSLLQSMT